MRSCPSHGAPGKFCPKNYFLKNVPVPETIHTFMLVSEAGPNAVLAVHYYAPAPQNFQTVLKLRLDDAEMKLFREARKTGRAPPLLQTRVIGKASGSGEDSTFCMEELRSLVKRSDFRIRGTLFADSKLDEYRLGRPRRHRRAPVQGHRRSREPSAGEPPRSAEGRPRRRR